MNSFLICELKRHRNHIINLHTEMKHNVFILIRKKIKKIYKIM